MTNIHTFEGSCPVKPMALGFWISLVLWPPADNISPRFYQQLLPVNATNEAAVTALPRAFAKAGCGRREVWALRSSASLGVTRSACRGCCWLRK